ncbi:MAG: SDR family oxidoreductase [Candidatus Omnitrophica bacterium]|nr:SDR family oxidoreductase [Candidatus Omnitrophota bacterium]
MKKTKTIFMTGATGFLGSNLAVRFLRRNYKLKLLIRGKMDVASKRFEHIISALFPGNEFKKFHKNIELITGDIIKENLGIPSADIDKLVGNVDDVFHCAALVSFDEKRKRETESQNIDGTRNVLELAKKLRRPSFHYLSTAYVAGNRKGIVYEDNFNRPQAFNNIYEDSKFKAESVVKGFNNKYGIRTIIYRPAIVVGDDSTGRTSNFFGFYGLIKSLYLLADMFKKDIKAKGQRAKSAGAYYSRGNILHIPLRVAGIANKTLNLVPVNYIVDVIDRIHRKDNALIKTYHITNPNPPTIGLIQQLVCKALGISGVKVVSPNEFLDNPMNAWEKFFAEGIRVYRPYLEKEEPIFSSKNTQEVLNGTFIKCPYITARLMSRLISFCIDSRWGQKL